MGPAAGVPFTSDVIVAGALAVAGASGTRAALRSACARERSRRRSSPATPTRRSTSKIIIGNDDAFGLCSDVTFTVPPCSTVFLVVGELGDNNSIAAYQVFVDFP